MNGAGRFFPRRVGSWVGLLFFFQLKKKKVDAAGGRAATPTARAIAQIASILCATLRPLTLPATQPYSSQRPSSKPCRTTTCARFAPRAASSCAAKSVRAPTTFRVRASTRTTRTTSRFAARCATRSSSPFLRPFNPIPLFFSFSVFSSLPLTSCFWPTLCCSMRLIFHMCFPVFNSRALLPTFACRIIALRVPVLVCV